MYQPMFTLDAKGIPIISNDEIDTLGERLVADFSPLDIFTPKAIDIDRFVTKYLKLKQDFYYLSHCGVYLGTTIFQETHCLPVFNPETISAEYAHVEAGTVIIDSSLMVDNQEHRYRFTMGHEGGHSILHPSYYLNSIGMVDEERSNAYVRCRADFKASKNEALQRNYHLSDKQRLEQQANYFASAILMPRCTVKMALARVPNKGQKDWGYHASMHLSKIFNTSQESAFYRLKALGYIDKSTPFTPFS